MKNGRETLILQQFEELVKAFPELSLSEDRPGCWAIRGTLSFNATFRGVCIADSYSILLTLPSNYPDVPPRAQETGGRIPASFHQYGDRTLCLGAPVEVYRRFRDDPSLLAFVETLVVEYLYGYSHFEKHGTLPFGELSHGCQGIREYYQDTFKTQDVHIVFALLKTLADGTYRGHHVCPCGSGKILRKCHGPILLSLLKNQTNGRFLCDAENVLYSLTQSEMEGFNWDLLPKQIRREFDEMAREKAKREKCA